MSFLPTGARASSNEAKVGAGALRHTMLGPYELVEFLGAGGMGEVYRALDPQRQRVVAIKILAPTRVRTTSADRFMNEARVQASLSHPNIAALYEICELEGRLSIVMEYVDGETLADRLLAGPLAIDDAMRFFPAIVDAVDYIHRRGIVHRDLKPGNVRISSQGEIKLLDFGIAKAESSPGLTRTGSVVGTPLYLSPEQLKTGLAGPKSDIWGLGILLYEMLTGRVPFDAPSLPDLWDMVRVGAYPKLSTVCASVSDDHHAAIVELDQVIARCLSANPDDRYESAQALLCDVQRLTGVSSRNSGWTTTSGHWSLSVEGCVITNVGCRRELNEDAGRLVRPADVDVLEHRGLLVMVADGMGGHRAGEVASGLAIDVIHRAYYASESDVARALADAFQEANKQIHEVAQAETRFNGMGTTCTALVLREGEATCAHVGDSRLYLFRDGRLYAMTEDHSAVQQMIAAGILTREEARNHAERNVILRALGTRETVEVTVWESAFEVRANDWLLLCTDGLHDLVTDDEIGRALESTDASTAGEALIALALARGAPDNVTVAVVNVRPTVEQAGVVRETREFMVMGES